MSLCSRFIIAASLLAGSVCGQDFAHEVAPILKKHCAECHLGEKKKGGFSMNTRELLLAGSEDGAVVKPGDPGGGKLIELLKSSDSDAMMPPKGDRVPPEKIELLRKWIASGMAWEDGFSFGKSGWEPPLKPRTVDLPQVQEGRINPVDRIVDKYLADHKTPRPATVSDSAFYRRLSLDVLGLLPDPDEADAFAGSSAPDKRVQLIARLLARDVDYAEHWLAFWNDLLRNDYAGTGYIDGGRKPITGWLYNALLDNKPYDVFARELLAPPSGDSEGFINGIKWRGNVNASQVREVQFAQSITQVFLGINMKCASCHDSFIDRWKLDEAYGLAAIFSDHPLEINRCDKPTGRMAKAAWIFPELGEVNAGAPQPERLKQLAGLMTHAENGRFTRTIVNRIWHRLMGRGIVHPVDAMHAEPWSADLLDWLAVWFADQKYDVKKLILLIASSQAYQAKSVPSSEAEAAYVYKGPIARHLTAEQFVDAVWRLTGTAPREANKSVKRGRTAAKKNGMTGKWIWTQAGASTAAPAGETATFRKKFTLPAEAPGQVAFSCDNSCEVYLDGLLLGKNDLWSEPSSFPIKQVKAGDHTLIVVAANGGSGPNPAGVLCEMRLLPDKSPEVRIASDASWEWVAGRLAPAEAANDALAWKPAAAVSNQGVWATAMPGLHDGLFGTAGGAGGAPVRASTVTSDLLQRALGRPNREQIVSMRPDNVTALEAIDLANGQILAGLLKKGAERTVAEWKGTPAALADMLCRKILTRMPEEEERAVLVSVLGEKPTPQAVEDVYWMLLMQPEFQFVR